MRTYVAMKVGERLPFAAEADLAVLLNRMGQFATNTEQKMDDIFELFYYEYPGAVPAKVSPIPVLWQTEVVHRGYVPINVTIAMRGVLGRNPSKKMIADAVAKAIASAEDNFNVGQFQQTGVDLITGIALVDQDGKPK